MCEASEHAACYVLSIEDYSELDSGSSKSTHFGSKSFQGRQMLLTMYAKEFLAMHFAFDEYGRFFGVLKNPSSS